MSYIGRDIAHHELYPNGSYVPKRIGLWAYLKERGHETFMDVKGHYWFWAACLSAFVWLSFHFVKWAVTVPGAMRIN